MGISTFPWEINFPQEFQFPMGFFSSKKISHGKIFHSHGKLKSHGILYEFFKFPWDINLPWEIHKFPWEKKFPWEFKNFPVGYFFSHGIFISHGNLKFPWDLWKSHGIFEIPMGKWSFPVGFSKIPWEFQISRGNFLIKGKFLTCQVRFSLKKGELEVSRSLSIRWYFYFFSKVSLFRGQFCKNQFCKLVRACIWYKITWLCLCSINSYLKLTLMLLFRTWQFDYVIFFYKWFFPSGNNLKLFIFCCGKPPLNTTIFVGQF